MSPIDVMEPEVGGAIEPVALEAITRGEVDLQIRTARAFPRSLDKFRRQVEQLTVADRETAEECFYAVPRKEKGKTKMIEGPSARFAELVAHAWTNLRIGAAVIAEDERFITVQGLAWDLETNVLRALPTRRRISTSDGRRYSDDMIVMTTNAAVSIATRNAILQVVPKVHWRQLYDRVRRMAVGDISTLATRRAEAIKYFEKIGVPLERLLKLLEVDAAEQITLDHVFTLRNIANAIREGDTTIDEAFPPDPPKEPRRVNGAEPSPQPPQGQSAPAGASAAPSAAPSESPASPSPDEPAAPAHPQVPAQTAGLFGGASSRDRNGTEQARGLVITETAVIAGPRKHWEIRARVATPGASPFVYIFVTEDEPLYRIAASCEGKEDRKFSIAWRDEEWTGSAGRRRVKVIAVIAADD